MPWEWIQVKLKHLVLLLIGQKCNLRKYKMNRSHRNNYLCRLHSLSCNKHHLFPYNFVLVCHIYCPAIRAGNYLFCPLVSGVDGVHNSLLTPCTFLPPNHIFITESDLQMMVGFLPQWLVPCITPKVAGVLLDLLLLAQLLFQSVVLYTQLLLR